LLVFHDWLKAKRNEGESQLKNDFLDFATKEVFLRSGGNILSSFSFAALPHEQRLKKVKFEGLDVLESAIGEGRGVVLLIAHMGPWEAIPSAISILIQNLGSQLGAIYRPLNNSLIENWYRSEREKQGLRPFNRKEEFNQAFKFLKGGGALALLADQRVKTGERSEFFGKPAMTTPLVGLLSKRVNAPVVSLTLGYDRNCNLNIGFRLVNYKEAKTRGDYAKITNLELERIISTDVTNEFWLHRRFLT
jgi:KDO2-lipid IV(A) lauroyltransferase